MPPLSLSLSLSLHSPLPLFLFPATPSLLSSPKPYFRPHSFNPTSFPYSLPNPPRNPNPNPIPTPNQEEDYAYDDDDRVIGDCLVFEEGAFEDSDSDTDTDSGSPYRAAPAKTESLVPDKWKEAVDEIRMTKKEKRKIAHSLRFGSKMERRKKSPVPDMEEYAAYRDLKLSQLKPVVLDDPKNLPPVEEGEGLGGKEWELAKEGRVVPRNPRLGLDGGSLEDISDLFSSGRYVPGEVYDDKKARGKYLND